MPLVQTYRLRGSTAFDHEYTLSLNMQEKRSKILFEGKKSTITWHTVDSKVVIHGQSNAKITIENYIGPFGILRSEGSRKSMERLIFTNVSENLIMVWSHQG